MSWRRRVDWLSLSVVGVMIVALQGVQEDWWDYWVAGPVIVADIGGFIAWLVYSVRKLSRRDRM